MVWTLAASVGVGPKAACSRNRRAAEGETSGFGTPTCTENGCETTGPLVTVRLSAPPVPANPVTVKDPAALPVTASAVPPNCTVDVEVKPVPAIVMEKTPRGNCAGATDEMVGATLLTSVTAAVPLPPGPVAVTVSAPE